MLVLESSGTESPNPLLVSSPALTYAKLMRSSLADTQGNSDTVTKSTATNLWPLAPGVEALRRSDRRTAPTAVKATNSQIRLRTVTNSQPL